MIKARVTTRSVERTKTDLETALFEPKSVVNGNRFILWEELTGV